MAAGTATITISATTPQRRRVRSLAVARLSVWSRQDIRRPIQVTGWPIAAEEAIRITELRLEGERQEGDQDGHERFRQGRDCGGGSITAAVSAGRGRCFRMRPEPWIDLSTGINPHSYPLFDLPATALTRLPEPGRVRANWPRSRRRPMARRRRDHVVPAPGTQILLPRVFSLVEAGPRADPRPDLCRASPRRRACRPSEPSRSAISPRSPMPTSPSWSIPTTPTDGSSPRADLLALADTLRRQGRAARRRRGLHGCRPARGIALRRCRARAASSCCARSASSSDWPACGSALPSRRRTIAERLDAEFGPWSVSGPALEYGIRALGDLAWQERMRERLAAEAARLDDLLARARCRRSTAAPACSGMSPCRRSRRCSQALGNSGILVAQLRRPSRTNFASACRAARRNGSGSKLRWRPGADKSGSREAQARRTIR